MIFINSIGVDVSQQGSGPPSSSCPTAGVIRYNSTPSGTLPSGDCMQAYKVNNYSGHGKEVCHQSIVVASPK